MNIDRAKIEIKNTVRIYLKKENGEYVIPIAKQRPILLIGAPGIGKTAIMSAIAEELDIGYVGYTITHHTRQSAIGLPFITKKIYGGKEYSVTEYTMSEIVASVYDAIEKQGKKEGILFIDEINCVSETLAPAMLELLQNKKFGPHKIPNGWILCSAGNPREYNKSATELDMVTLDRVKRIIVEPDYDAFSLYASNNSIHEAISCFLALNRQFLFKAEKTLDGFEFVTPRGWEDLSVALTEYERENIAVSLPFVFEYVQSEEIASQFYSYYKSFQKYKDVYLGESVENGTANTDLGEINAEDRFAISKILTAKAIAVAEKTMIKGEALSLISEETKEGENIDYSVRAAYYESKAMNASLRKKAVYKSVIDIFNYKNPIEKAEEERLEYEKSGNSEAKKINNILLFGEKVLGKRQELTSSVSDMTANEDFVAFLSEFGSEEFFRLNEELLIGADVKKLAEEILKK